MPASTDSENASVTLDVEGMMCAACQGHVERALRETPGVAEASVNFLAHSARVVYNPAVAPTGTLIEAVRGAGYEAHLAAAHHEEAVSGDPDDLRSERLLKLRAFFTIAAGAVAMLLSLPLMNEGAAMTRSGLDHVFMTALPWLYLVPPAALKLILFAITAAAMFWAGARIYTNAWSAALHRTTNMNTLVALGTGAGFLYSAAATFAPTLFARHGLRPDVYYESVVLILGFLLLGQWLEARAKRRTLDALRAFSQLQPQSARVLREGAEVEVPLAAVVPGDVVVVRPGERIPVDGVVTAGVSTVDESLLTGESAPVARALGDRLIGGSLNYDGSLEYKATSVGADSVLGQMVRLMQQAQSSKAPMQQLADRASAVFVPIVLALAALTFAAWAWLDPVGGISRAVAVSITVLVIACPCAMGLAVPAAQTVAIGRGAQLGILFKGGEALERLAHIDAVLFDKTGTLTNGRPVITSVHAGPNTSEAALIQMAASLEQRSEHPLAHAVLELAKQRQIEPEPVSELRVHPGKGITGLIKDVPAAAGNRALMEELRAGLSGHESPAATPLYIASGGRLLGWLEAEDTIRPGAAAAVEALAHEGLEAFMLTGDTPAAANHIAAQVGIRRVHASLLPAQKLDVIRDLQHAGRKVAMVGDGINDAAALAQADAGLAMGTGTDLAREAGDAILLRGEPASILAAIRLARRTLGVMRQNLGWALGYNLLGIPIAAGVLYPALHLLLSPAIASAAMALSSVSVLTNSLRLRGFRA